MRAGCRLGPDDPHGLTHRLGTGAGLARGARAGPRLHLRPLTSSCFVLSMLSLVLPELWPEPEWQLGPTRERAEGPVLFKASPKLARSHFCCLLLVRAFTEPTHFHETPPADGRGFGANGRGCWLPSLQGALAPLGLLPGGLVLPRTVRPSREMPAKCMGSEESRFIFNFLKKQACDIPPESR